MITVEKATKYYGSHCAVRDLDFSIAKGECVGFLGLNGAGKSTTLRLLSCLLLPTSGRVTIGGLDVEERPHDIRRLIGYLPETPPLYGEMTVHEFLVFAGRLRGMAPEQLDRRLREVVPDCGLDRVIDAPISTLSHGFRQRAGIAQAIIHEPPLLILDEPTLGLDPMQVVEMREMIKRFRGSHTILLSTHMLSEIEATCDRILMMHEGAIAAEGSEAELAARYGGGGDIEVEVLGSAEAVGQALALVPTTEPPVVTVLGDVVRARLSTDDDARAAVSAAVVGAGLGLLGLRRVTSGLESVFLRLSDRPVTARVPASEASA